MSRIPALPIAVAIAVTAPVAALVTVAVQGLARRKGPVTVRVAEFGIRNVPDRPALWRTSTAPVAQVRPADADPVPPENPHAPPTPASGIRQVR